MRRVGSGRCYNRKIFGDVAADDTGRIATVRAVQLDGKLASIVAVGFLISNVDHIEVERRQIRTLLLTQVVSHRLFEVGFYFRCRKFSLTAGGKQGKDG